MKTLTRKQILNLAESAYKADNSDLINAHDYLREIIEYLRTELGYKVPVGYEWHELKVSE